MDAALNPIDFTDDLAIKVGDLMPWIEPALRFLTTEHFDVRRRQEVLSAAGSALILDYHDDTTLFVESIAQLELDATNALATFVLRTARLLQLKAEDARG